MMAEDSHFREQFGKFAEINYLVHYNIIDFIDNIDLFLILFIA